MQMGQNKDSRTTQMEQDKRQDKRQNKERVMFVGTLENIFRSIPDYDILMEFKKEEFRNVKKELQAVIRRLPDLENPGEIEEVTERGKVLAELADAKRVQIVELGAGHGEKKINILNDFLEEVKKDFDLDEK